MSLFLKSGPIAKLTSNRLLAVGDLLAFLAFAVLGRIMHGATGPADWLLNGPRVAAPFLVGWIVAAVAFGAYPGSLPLSPRRFVLRSLLALLVGVLIALAVRAYIFSEAVTLTFAGISLAFTTFLVVGWRLLYVWFASSKVARFTSSRVERLS